MPASLNVVERLARARTRRIVGRPAYALLKLLGVELPRSVDASTARFPHGAVGLVVHPSTVLGRGVMLYQGVTIGRSDTHLHAVSEGDGHARLDDGVVVGAGAAILFKSGQTLTVGEGAVIGANSVVTHSIPAGEVWAGNPARQVSSR